MSLTPGILARGRWALEQVEAAWLATPYEPPARATDAADAAISALRERGSPAHDGLSARLVVLRRRRPSASRLELEPIRWALRLDRTRRVAERRRDVRGARQRRPLARGASRGLARDLVGPLGARRRRRRRGRREPGAHARARAARGMVGHAPSGSRSRRSCASPSSSSCCSAWPGSRTAREVVPDEEHDEFAWWPAEVDDWPAEADEPLRAMATMLAVGPWREARRRDRRTLRRVITFKRLERRVVPALAGLLGAADRRVRPGQPAAGDVHPRPLARPAVDRHVAGLPARRCGCASCRCGSRSPSRCSAASGRSSAAPSSSASSAAGPAPRR